MYKQYGNYNPRPAGTNFKQLIFGRNALSRLLLINLIVFVVVFFVRTVIYLFYTDYQSQAETPISGLGLWLAVPASLSTLAQKPWTVITYMFLHESLLHILFNMIMLYFSGRIFMEYLSGKKLVFVYLLGGLSGAGLYILAFNVLPVFQSVTQYSVALGASASVLAILAAVATYVPNYSVPLIFLGRLKLKYIALIFVAVDIISIERSNPGGHIAHLGGALFGFAYIVFMKKGMDMSKLFNPVGRFFKNLFKPRPKLRTSYSKRPLTDDEFNEKRADRQKRIDVILDKIAKSGYESLTREEKEMLFKASKNEF